MIKNVGQIDAIIRIILAVIVAILGYYYQTWWGLLALVPLATALLKFCPLYTVLGFNSSKKNKQDT